MRGLVLVALLAACAGDPEAQVDAAAPQPSPPGCGIAYPLLVGEAYQVVSDGTDLFISVRALDGTMQLLTMPISGGTPTTLLTAPDKFALSASADAVFYQLRVGSSYELHQRIAGADTVLGTVPANAAIELAAGVTDLYVLGPANDGRTTLWRLPRTGFTDAPPIVASIAEHGEQLKLGNTIVAFLGASGWWRVRIPGPSTPSQIVVNDGGKCCSFVGDMGFGLAAAQMMPGTIWAFVKQYTPTQATLWQSAFTGVSIPSGLATDDRYIYVIGNGGFVMKTDGTKVTSSCLSPGNFSSYDLTHLFAVWGQPTGPSIVVMPKPL
jgi:hypothetical protein